MSRSKYPEEIDTSVEIPHVRDNILEVGSDVLNSIRSAIFQIEKTLGVNPQGAVGNSLSSRISRSIDSRGNIKKEALDRANILSGPIIDSDVSKVAAIREYKLRLDFPTQLLQDEISILNNQIDSIIEKVDELNLLLSIHVSPEATNRHKAKAITVEEIGSDESSEASMSLEEQTLQSALEELYSSHIHYDGSDISPENRSHDADQIYFNSENVVQVTSEDDVQGAIEDIALSSFFQAVEHQDLFHSNGILRLGSITRSASSELGVELVESSPISYSTPSATDSSKTTEVTFIGSVDTPSTDISKSDILSIGEDGASYEVESVTLSSTGSSVERVTVFGTFDENSLSDTEGNISKNIKAEINKASLLVSAREVPFSDSSSYLLQICNPSSVAIISSNIRPLELDSLSSLEVSVDGEDPVSLDLYSSEFSQQSIDSVISKINEQVSENYYSFLAYRLDLEEGGSELVIAHNLPSDADNIYSLEITGGNLDGTGLSSDNGIILATYGSQYYIQGYPYQGLDKKLDIDGEEAYFTSSTNYITSFSGDINFKTMGVYSGDLIVITGSGSDDGTYAISQVEEDQIVIGEPLSSLGFSEASTEDVRFLIYRNSASLASLEFEEISESTAGMLVDIFIDSNQEVFVDKRVEYNCQVNDKYQSMITIVDFYGKDVNQASTISMTLGSGGSVELSMDDGDVAILGSDRIFTELRSGKYNTSLRIFTDRISDMVTEISSSTSGVLEISVVIMPSVNTDTNLLIARVPYDNFRGEITGGEIRSYANDKQTRRVIPILEKGNVGINDISSSLKRDLIYNRFAETRSDGVVFGLEVSNVAIDSDDIYTFDVSAGIAYVNGKRFEISLVEGFVSGIDSTYVDNFYIAVDESGNIVARPAGASGGVCYSPFGGGRFAVLASVELSGTTVTSYDLRLFISALDEKLLNAITVSPRPGMGHFTDIGKALKYAKRFSDIYPGAGTPTIHLKSGTHNIVYSVGVDYADRTDQIKYNAIYEQGIWINFPVKIIGEGDGTVIDIIAEYEDYPASGDDREGSGSVINDGYIYIAGAGLTTTPSADVDVLTEGQVLLKDFKMNLSGVIIIDPAFDNNVNRLVSIENVTFDFSEKSGFGSNNVGVYSQSIDYSSSDDVGNIAIEKCKFLNCMIRLNSWSADKWFNFRFNNNTLVPISGLGSSKGHYFIYQDSANTNADDHIMVPYYPDYLDATAGREVETGQFVQAIGNNMLAETGEREGSATARAYWDQNEAVPLSDVTIGYTDLDSLNVGQNLNVYGTTTFYNSGDNQSNFYCGTDAFLQEDVTLGSHKNDTIRILGQTYFDIDSNTSWKPNGVGIGTNVPLNHPSGGSVVHFHEKSSNRAYLRFTNTTTGTQASEAQDIASSSPAGPGTLMGLTASENFIITNTQRYKAILFGTTDGIGDRRNVFGIHEKGWVGINARAKTVTGTMGWPSDNAATSPKYPVDIRGKENDRYIVSIFNSHSNDADDGRHKTDVLLLGMRRLKPGTTAHFIKFQGTGTDEPSAGTGNTLGGVRGTKLGAGQSGAVVSFKAAFYNFSNETEDGDSSSWNAPYSTPAGYTMSGTTIAHAITPALIEDYGNYSKVWGGKGVQFFTGANDFGEWLPIANKDEWPEISETEAHKKEEEREIFGLQEGMVVYIRNGAIHRNGPGTAMAVTHRAALVGNAAWKDTDRSLCGEIVSFIGQLPIIVKGSVNDGDYLIPEENYCIAISKDDITFEQYRDVVGTAWESFEQKEPEEFFSVLCAVGIK